MDVRHWYIKASSREYWPMWILYVPVFIQHLWLSFKAGSLFYFLKVNPGRDEGFILSDSKYQSLKDLPNHFRPKTVFVRKESAFREVLLDLQRSGIQFPMILKPDIGYRGKLVKVLADEFQLAHALRETPVNYLLQEFINLPEEYGVFYYRIPGRSQGQIPSLTIKQFLKVTGDGQKTIGGLIGAHSRAYLHKDRLKQTLDNDWSRVLKQGETIELETIGNHNRGTKFVNGNHLIDAKLVECFDRLVAQIPGFYFGRFDIKAASLEELRQGVNFKVIEVNGIGAEPTHVYDPGYSLLRAWRDMLFIWKIAWQIAMENHRNGERFPVFSEAKARYLQYLNYKRTAFTC